MNIAALDNNGLDRVALFHDARPKDANTAFR